MPINISGTNVTGITSIRDTDDAVNKAYVDGKTGSAPPIQNQEGEFLYTDGTTLAWEPITNYSEYTTTGSYTFDVPSYAKEVLIEATGAGGAGASGNTDGDSWNFKEGEYWI